MVVDPEDDGLLERLDQAVWLGAGQVDHRPRQARDRQPVDDVTVDRIDAAPVRPDAVQAHALVMADDDVRLRHGAQQAAHGGRRPVREQRVLTSRPDRDAPPALAREVPMTDRVHPVRHPVQRAVGGQVADRAAREAVQQQLPPRDDAELLGREAGERRPPPRADGRRDVRRDSTLGRHARRPSRRERPDLLLSHPRDGFGAAAPLSSAAPSRLALSGGSPPGSDGVVTTSAARLGTTLIPTSPGGHPWRQTPRP
jgi:hypothetical protein